MFPGLVLIISMASVVSGQPSKCDHTPLGTIEPPMEAKYIPFSLTIQSKGKKGKYLPDQTYVLKLEALDVRPFREFMITVEDPTVDDSAYNDDKKLLDVGTLKTLDEDSKSRYSERCFNTVENTDMSEKYTIVVHWISPKESSDQDIRFRAMVAENKDVWYENLTIVLEKDDELPEDTPPLPPLPVCNLCSEARYEVIFTGMWSRGSHPRHYPSKPDETGFGYMVGASHDYNYVLWQQGVKGSEGLHKLAVDGDISAMEREIIGNMSVDQGTRTLIRGKRRHHPHMFEPSHSLFRVDRVHHLFSIAVAMRPSPDWFLGTSKFELCTEEGWLEYHSMPLYPWDAGKMDGISYDSARSLTQPEDNVERVEVGSFDRDSPFYQMNLNDLKRFATLEVRRLDVYPLDPAECAGDSKEYQNGDENGAQDEEPQTDYLLTGQRRDHENQYCFSQWSKWSPCVANNGFCGKGTQTRTRYVIINNDPYDMQENPLAKCEDYHKGALSERRRCKVQC